MNWWFVLPALKVSGGSRESLRLADEMSRQGAAVGVLCMWQVARPMSTSLPVEHLSEHLADRGRALAQLPGMLPGFRAWWKRALARARGVAPGMVFTHYVTLPLSLIVPARRRCFHVQDLEWKFVGNPLASRFLRAMILYCYRRGTLVSANSFLTAALRDLGLDVAFEMPVWADEQFLAESGGTRDVDFVVMLRKGAHKRLDLYHAFIEAARRHGGLRLAVISPDEELAAPVRATVDLTFVSPSLAQMRELYARSRCLVHLSDHEGFGLPPLEAMAAGCVPLCRDSGGVRAYMSSEALRPLLLPLSLGMDEILRQGLSLLGDPSRLRALSQHSREVFKEGLQTATRLRNERIGHLLGTRPVDHTPAPSA